VQYIFIGGCDRSGTTVLASLLASHEQGVAIPEAQFKSIFIDEMRRLDYGETVDSEQLLKKLKASKRFNAWDIDAESLQIKNKITTYSELRGIFDSLVIEYAKKHHKDKPKYCVDHTPNNVMIGHRLLQLYEGARFLHILRDGRAVVASIIKRDWGPTTISRATDWWLKQVAYGLALESSKFSDSTQRVYYENLISRTREELQNLCNFCGISYSDEMLKGNGFVKPAYAEKDHANVGKPLEVNRINAWKNDLTNEEVHEFEARTFDFIECLGYTPMVSTKEKPIGLRKNKRIKNEIYELSMKFLIKPIRRKSKWRKTK